MKTFCLALVGAVSTLTACAGDGPSQDVQDAASQVDAASDNEVGPYFDCTANMKDAVTQIELTSSRTPLTGAGPDLSTVVH
jgi:hypothetical protein